jgi:hypothetical protein
MHIIFFVLCYFDGSGRLFGLRLDYGWVYFRFDLSGDHDVIFFNLGGGWLGAEKCLLLFLFFDWGRRLHCFRRGFPVFRYN